MVNDLVSSSTFTDWKRWVAALCVVLLAFVVIERASGDHVSMLVKSEAASVIMLSSADTPTDTDHSPAQPSHHCCATHAGSLAPALVAASAPMPPSVNADGLRLAHATPLSVPGGLDRPPKPIAIA